MDSLRISLLVIGVLVFAGITLWEIVKQSNKPATRAHYPDENELGQDDYPELKTNTASPSDKGEDFAGAVTDLGNLLTESRNEISGNLKSEDGFQYSLDISATEVKPEINDKFDSAFTEQTHSEDDYSDEISEDDADSSKQDVVLSDEPEKELIVLFITAAKNNIFNGLSISRAAQEAGLVYGHMNIFHHFGLGKMKSSQPLFSMANMFEPGSFDLGKISELKTNGIVLFMYSPATIDGQVVFELFLNSVRRIAETLGGDIRNSNKKLLTNADIEMLRERVKSHIDND